ncbi:MAG: hypothetical protein ACJA0P_002453, partial [Planctomycetota bacterium]
MRDTLLGDAWDAGLAEFVCEPLEEEPNVRDDADG